MIIAVAVEKVLYKTDRLFYYNVPPNIKICLGQTVLVPFGTQNIIRRAFVFKIFEDENRVDLKEVYSAVENAYVLTEEQIKIASIVSNGKWYEKGEKAPTIKVSAFFLAQDKRFPSLWCPKLSACYSLRIILTTAPRQHKRRLFVFV